MNDKESTGGQRPPSISEDERRKALQGLNPSECKMLFWRCRGQTWAQVGQNLGIAQRATYSRVETIYRKLGITGSRPSRNYQLMQYCPILLAEVQDPDTDCERFLRTGAEQAVAVEQAPRTPSTAAAKRAAREVPPEWVDIWTGPSVGDSTTIIIPCSPGAGVSVSLQGATATVHGQLLHATHGLAMVSPLFVDDFESGLQPAWRVLEGDWQVADGRLVNASQEGQGLLLIGNPSLSNYAVDAHTYWDPQVTEQAGIVVRATPRGRMEFAIYPDSYRWWRYDEGQEPVECARYAHVPLPKARIEIRVQVRGDTFRAFVSSDPEYRIQDSTFPNGAAGLSGGRGAAFGYFELSSLP